MSEYEPPFARKDLPDYVSPFNDKPDLIKCTSPNDAQSYMRMHQRSGRSELWGTPCPVHENKPNAVEPVVDPSWKAWYGYREKYARGEDPEWNLKQMLHQVSETCPPDAPKVKSAVVRHAARNTLATVTVLLAIMIIVLAMV